MYNLPMPVANDQAEYDRVCGTRSATSRTALAPWRQHVFQAYQNYQAATAASLPAMAPVIHDEEAAKLLQGNFRRMDSRGPCSDIRSELLVSARQGLCPYCRMAEATVLDHILEKSVFPEFSVLRRNLAPVCWLCNTKKQNNASMVASLPRFHLYVTGYPVARFLYASVAVTAQVVQTRFFIKNPLGVPQLTFDAVRGHFDSLELASRYARKAISELGDRAHRMRQLHAVSGAGGVQDYLYREAESIERNWSINDWRFALLRAAGDSPDYCDSGIFY